eukprot:6184459-Pleurochrysis_carterae.AAC.2
MQACASRVRACARARVRACVRACVRGASACGAVPRRCVACASRSAVSVWRTLRIGRADSSTSADAAHPVAARSAWCGSREHSAWTASPLPSVNVKLYASGVLRGRSGEKQKRWTPAGIGASAGYVHTVIVCWTLADVQTVALPFAHVHGKCNSASRSCGASASLLSDDCTAASGEDASLARFCSGDLEMLPPAARRRASAAEFMEQYADKTWHADTGEQQSQQNMR